MKNPPVHVLITSTQISNLHRSIIQPFLNRLYDEIDKKFDDVPSEADFALFVENTLKPAFRLFDNYFDDLPF